MTPREHLGRALEYGHRRPKFVANRLERHIERVFPNEQAENPVDYVVHFSDGTVVGLVGVEHNEKNERAYRKRAAHGDLTVITIVVRTAKDLLRCVQDLLGQLAWHSKSLFGAVQRNKRLRQNGERPTRYRDLRRDRPGRGSR